MHRTSSSTSRAVPAGFNVELTRAIAEVLGISVEVRLGLWGEIRLALVRDEIDLRGLLVVVSNHLTL